MTRIVFISAFLDFRPEFDKKIQTNVPKLKGTRFELNLPKIGKRRVTVI